MPYSAGHESGDVAARSRQAFDEAGSRPDRATMGNTIGTVRVACRSGRTVEAPCAKITSGARATKSVRVLANFGGIDGRAAGIDVHIAAGGPARCRHHLQKHPDPGLIAWIISRLRAKLCRHAARDRPAAPAPPRPRRRRTPEKRNDVAALQWRAHSITSSARASSIGGTARPSALAVFRLITSSYLVGACAGRSAGFSPLRMRST